MDKFRTGNLVEISLLRVTTIIIIRSSGGLAHRNRVGRARTTRPWRPADVSALPRRYAAYGPPLGGSAHGRKVLHASRPTRTLAGGIVAQKFCLPPPYPPPYATATVTTAAAGRHPIGSACARCWPCTTLRRCRLMMCGIGTGGKVSKRFFIEQTFSSLPVHPFPIQCTFTLP